MSVYNPIELRSYRRNAGHTGNPAAVKTTLSVRALPVILVCIMGNPVQVANDSIIAQETQVSARRFERKLAWGNKEGTYS
jgi:hypothetical protein